ncbi:MAG: zinc ribbon domain-containing protein [Planctomycetes bacterium]|jgi:hypothetical protein|nr:zinc ribbon domain-containing protein [Planctomycetota bacterium]
MAGRRSRPAPDECSHCGTRIPRGALACPECGADGETGWDANPFEDETALDLPDHLTEDYDPRYDGPVLPGETWASAGRRFRVAAAVLALAALLAFALWLT